MNNIKQTNQSNCTLPTTDNGGQKNIDRIIIKLARQTLKALTTIFMLSLIPFLIPVAIILIPIGAVIGINSACLSGASKITKTVIDKRPTKKLLDKVKKERKRKREKEEFRKQFPDNIRDRVTLIYLD
jgi:hypothetical protein